LKFGFNVEAPRLAGEPLFEVRSSSDNEPSFLFACTPMKQKPNIIYILADDMGYGDLSCLNERSAWQTPNLDRLANEGMAFTDAHSTSAVCTPSRYSILTGRYNWRSYLKAGVLGGFNRALIEPGRMTAASYLKDKGYRTGCFGKWHLGLDWEKVGTQESAVDYAKPFAGGPCDHGFDTFYGISASLDMPPYTYIQDREVPCVPSLHDPGSDDGKVCFHESKGIWRAGPRAPDFKHHEAMPRFTEKCIEFIDDAGRGKDPFFVYYPLTAPHTPILPTEAFRGKSGTTDYGDFCLQVDADVGRILDKLDRLGISDNTIVIFTSDNGCSPRADFRELAMFGHNPSYVFRGQKGDIYEGGHRVPLLVRWPGQIEPGCVSDETVCLVDFLATCADLFDEALPDDAGEDSVSNLPVWRGETMDARLRKATVHHSLDGSFSIRRENWKLECCAGSGGWSYPTIRKDQGDLAKLPPMQLYNLESDIRERSNVIDEHPELVKEMLNLLWQYVESGRSTPGKLQQNHPEMANSWEQLWWVPHNGTK
jgi:arylsulfatase A-like enzyme